MHAVLGLCMAEMRGSPAPAVADLVFAAALTVPDGGVTMQCVLQPDGGFTVYGAAPDGGWPEHASGRIEAESGPPPPSLDLAAEPARLAADPDGPQALYDMLAGRGHAHTGRTQGRERRWM